MDRAHPCDSKAPNLNDSQTRVVQQLATSSGRSFQNQSVPISSRGNDELGQDPRAHDQDVEESTAAALEAWHLEVSIPSVQRPSSSIYQGRVKSERDREAEEESAASDVVGLVAAGALAPSQRKTKQSLNCPGCKRGFGRMSALKQVSYLGTSQNRKLSFNFFCSIFSSTPAKGVSILTLTPRACSLTLMTIYRRSHCSTCMFCLRPQVHGQFESQATPAYLQSSQARARPWRNSSSI